MATRVRALRTSLVRKFGFAPAEKSHVTGRFWGLSRYVAFQFDVPLLVKQTAQAL
jgi:hypothetical protein